LADVVFARAIFDWRIGIKEVRKEAVLTAGDTPPNPAELLGSEKMELFKEVRKVAVLTAGNTPSDPAELLSSEKMELFLSELEEVADVVIIDGPPLFVPDAMILASKVDGVLLVVRPGYTRRSLAKAAMEHIKLVKAKVFGVVLNRIPLRGADYYAGKSYLHTYYSSNYGYEREGKEKKNFPESIFFIDLEKLRETLSPYANKVTDFIKHLRSRFQT
jgi:Mrp family chromosome partitioning ATPase